MNKLKSSLLNMVLVLGGIAIISSLLLALVHNITETKIAQVQSLEKQEAIKNVISSFDKLQDSEVTSNGEKFIVHTAYKSGEEVGMAIETLSKNGFGGTIKLIVGFDKNGVITDYEVLEHKETPGLGANIESWFKSEDPKRSIKGKNPAECKMVVSKDGGDIDAITASTISSRAFLEAVRNAYEVFCKKNNINSIDFDAYSGASQLETKEESIDSLQVDSIEIEEPTVVEVKPIKRIEPKVQNIEPTVVQTVEPVTVSEPVIEPQTVTNTVEEPIVKQVVEDVVEPIVEQVAEDDNDDKKLKRKSRRNKD